jgi:type II secretory pathway pseudopilin PulG
MYQERQCSPKKFGSSGGFMLVEVLIALALFGMSAVFLVDGVGTISKAIREMKNTRELEQDLIWVRSQIFQESDYEKMEEGGDITAPTMGEIRWEAEVEMLTEVLDVFKVTLNLEYEGNSDFNVEPGERSSIMYLFRPTWSQNSDFARERNDVLEEKRDKIRELQEERRRL